MIRPPFIIASAVPEEEGRYPQNDEILGYSRPIGRASGKRDA
jgi:hypothetical protein